VAQAAVVMAMVEAEILQLELSILAVVGEQILLLV
jgi:hypothetical protein